MKNQKKLLFASGAIASLLAVIIVLMLPSSLIVQPDSTHITTHSVRSGDTLSRILTPHGISGAEVMEIARLLRSEANIRRIRADSDIVIIKRPEESEPVNKVILRSSHWRQVECARAEGWSCAQVDIERDIQLVLRSGEIRDGDSFYLAGLRAGIPESVLSDAWNLLAFEMDFERDMRAGQQFSALFEENHDANGFVSNGNIIALKFNAGRTRGILRMYRFTKANGRSSYYDEQGDGAIKSLRRTPINNARVTSSFGNRRHPVLGFTRQHRGVDFRASHGTPIPSAGAGTVVRRGWCNGLGNFVRIRHNATFETVYGHMSRFHPDVRVGTQVRQGQIIGFVGSTGVSTGPHLHYEIIKNGRHVNPMTVQLPSIDNLKGKDREEFLRLRPKIDAAKEFLRQNPAMVIYQ